MSCHSHCNAKCHLLGELEQKIMDVLWLSPDPLKPSNIVERLSNSHAYTTITTVLKRMSDKNLVRRKAQGNVFYYTPVQCKSDFACNCLDDLFSRLFDSYGQDVISAFNRVSKKYKY